MKKVLKGLGVLLGVIVVGVGGFVAYCAIDGIPHFKQPVVDLKVEITPARVARGKKLASLLCAECHKDPTTGKLTGKLMSDAPREFGEIHSRNITQSKTHGIGEWTDGELVVLLRTGIARDGRYTPPWMAKLPHMSDEDLQSIVAFLRSDDPMVAASEEPSVPCKVSLLSKVLTHTVFRPLPMPAAVQTAPAKTDKVAYGRYLVTNALDCYTCHSADFKTMNVKEPEKSPGFMAGDNALVGLSQEKIYSANLTFDEETGIGKWTEAQLKRALRDGIRPDNTLVRYPMEPMRDLDDDDVAAIYAYLAQVPKIHKARHPNPPMALAAGGQRRAEDLLQVRVQLVPRRARRGRRRPARRAQEVRDRRGAREVDPQRAVVQARHQDADVGGRDRRRRVRAAHGVRAQARAGGGARRRYRGRRRIDRPMTLS